MIQARSAAERTPVSRFELVDVKIFPTLSSFSQLIICAIKSSSLPLWLERLLYIVFTDKIVDKLVGSPYVHIARP